MTNSFKVNRALKLEIKRLRESNKALKAEVKGLKLALAEVTKTHSGLPYIKELEKEYADLRIEAAHKTSKIKYLEKSLDAETRMTASEKNAFKQKEIELENKLWILAVCNSDFYYFKHA